MIKKAIFLMGPTAAGKTDAAIFLHQKFGCDIISVDSALVYKKMDIGTAKPDAETLIKAPHALVDIIHPHERYSAADFCNDAKELMNTSQSHNKVPLLAGGTMMYYNSLQKGLTPLPVANEQIRKEILKQADQHGWQFLHEQLQKLDPQSAARIHQNDPQRIQRALEVIEISGKTMTQLYLENDHVKLKDKLLKIVIAPDRALLHERIEQRFEHMLDHGFIEEVEQLKSDKNLTADMPSMRCVGYRQVWQYLEGKYSFDEMKYKGIVATRQLAKRQWTWLRKEQDVTWLDSTQKGYLEKINTMVDEFISSTE